jgi:hypothetical protein
LIGEGGGASGKLWREAEDEELPSSAVLRLMGEILNLNPRLSEILDMKHNLLFWGLSNTDERDSP